MSKPVLLLRHGIKKLDLNDQVHYWLALDFVPPATAYAAQFAEGMISNRKEGGTLVSRKALNRSLSFTVRLSGSSAGDIAQSARAMQAMLNYAGDTSIPLYLEYSPNSNVPEPLWGQFGAHLHYEVVDGDLTLDDGYLIGVRRAEDVNMTVRLTLKPFAKGVSQRLASVTGGILDDTMGTADGLSRGLIVAEETTNEILNPVFGHADFDNQWTAGSNLTISENVDSEFILWNTKSAKLSGLASLDCGVTQTLTLTADTYSISCYAKRIDGGVIDDSVMELCEDEFGADELYDPDNIFSGYDGITGVTLANSDDGHLYILSLQGSFPTDWYFEIYADAGHTNLVGHCAETSGSGVQAIIEDNSSGIGGTLNFTVGKTTVADALWNNRTVTTTFTEVGSGWYRATATFTATGSAQGVGMVIWAGNTVYVDGVQVELKDYATPMCYGDLRGCAWDGTAHASSSTRTTAICRITSVDDVINAESGTVRVIWRPDQANTGVWDSVGTLFDTRSGGSAGLYAVYDPSTDVFVFSNGTDTVTSGNQTFSARSGVVLHFVWNTAKLTIYRNGASLGDTTITTLPTLNTYLYFGSANTGADYANGTLQVATFHEAFTSTQAAEDYSDISPVLANGRQVDAIPWMWTTDGDNIVENCLDSTHRNYTVCGGVTGSVEAETEIQGTIETLDLSAMKGIVLSRLDADQFFKPENVLFFDQSGTVDANACGGQYVQVTASTETALMGAVTPGSMGQALNGKSLTAFARVYDNGANFQIATAFLFGRRTIMGQYATVTTTNAWRLIKGQSLYFRLPEGIEARLMNNITVGLMYKRSTGSATLRFDYMTVLTEPIAIIGDGTQTTQYYRFRLLNAHAHAMSSGGYFEDVLNVLGSDVTLEPDRINYLISLLGYGAVDPAIARTLTYNSISITPRWALL
jgi:hypothetical protein